MYILDTDTLTHYLRGHTKVRARFATPGPEIAITAITRAEQLQGRFASVFKAANRAELLVASARLAETEKDLDGFTVIGLDEASADEFVKLLRVRGLKRIGRPDLLIASIALARKATLVTCNVKDFKKVPGLMIEDWSE